MKKPIADHAAIDAELASLADLTPEPLKARWMELKGVPLPKFMRRGLMILAVGQAIQEAAFGGLDPAAKKLLDVQVTQIVPTGAERPPLPPKRRKIRVGTKLIRDWQGERHEVHVVKGGFVWKGECHASLSVIARNITGTRWNGWTFFGLKKLATGSAAGNSAPASPAAVPGPDPLGSNAGPAGRDSAVVDKAVCLLEAADA